MKEENYEDRILLFLDILGFKELINSSIKNSTEEFTVTQSIIKLINEIETVSKTGNKFSSKEVTQFSDTIVISFLLTDDKELHNCFYNINRILAIMLKSGFIFRGSITIGKLYHKDNLIFGPALVEAYNLELNSAIFPRVIINKQCIEIMKKQYTNNYKHKYRINTFDTNLYFLLKHDQDGFFYVDYFMCYIMFLRDKELMETDNKIRNKIKIGTKNTNSNVRAKYDWMKAKYNEMIDSFDDLLIDEVDLFIRRPDIELYYKQLSYID